jgi:hypothetical protein
MLRRAIERIACLFKKTSSRSTRKAKNQVCQSSHRGVRDNASMRYPQSTISKSLVRPLLSMESRD